MPEGWTALICDSCGGMLELLLDSPPGMLTVTGLHSSTDMSELAEVLSKSMEKAPAIPILISGDAKIELVEFNHPLQNALRCVNCKGIYQKDEI